MEITTGHNNLAYHQSLVNPWLSPTCNLCEEARESFYHFVTECPRLRQMRIDTNNDNFNPDSWKPEDLLALARVPAVEDLLNRT